MNRFLETLRNQRHDDHRYYHHSLVNQSLHLVSAISFLCAYVLAYGNLALAVLIGWLVGMTSRQIGHFFFEPRDYDVVNQATDEYKEAIKVGFNIRRKVVLMTVWGLSPLLLVFDRGLPALEFTSAVLMRYGQDLGYLWLAVGVSGLLFRTVQLFVIQDAVTGLAWATKILTDPFNDAELYWRAPWRLARGGLFVTPLAPEYPEEIESHR